MSLTGRLGMNKQIYFLDTYAFFEIIRGNPNYKKYTQIKAVTTIFNIAELNYNLKKEKSKKLADKITKKYYPMVISVNFDDIKKAMNLKIERKEMSIPDVIGYIVAEHMGIKFLTGDEDFRGMKNVEFVK